jgi:hypothetical protein
VRLELNATKGTYGCWIDGRQVHAEIEMQEKIAELQRIEFRTGAWRQAVPNPIIGGEPGSPGLYQEDLPGADTPVTESVYYIDDVKTFAL